VFTRTGGTSGVPYRWTFEFSGHRKSLWDGKNRRKVEQYYVALEEAFQVPPGLVQEILKKSGPLSVFFEGERLPLWQNATDR
jgi:hypothetical protein